jgi:hypothetical protein
MPAETVLTSDISGNQGRNSEECRRLTFLVLFTPNGRPGCWLMLVALSWALVAGVALGQQTTSRATSKAALPEAAGRATALAR